MDSADAAGVLAFDGCKQDNCCIKSQPMARQTEPLIDDAKSERTTMRTLHIRIKDKHAQFLRALAYDTNQVWNFCQALSIKVFERECRFMSGYDLQKYTDGASKEGINLHPDHPGNRVGVCNAAQAIQEGQAGVAQEQRRMALARLGALQEVRHYLCAWPDPLWQGLAVAVG